MAAADRSLKWNERVRQLRKECGLTQGQLARVTKTSQQQIQRIEAGQEPSVLLAMRIAKAFGMTVEQVFK